MNEAEYLFHQDIREKKAAGRGIYHKRNGSRTSYVSLPSDKLTPAQMKRRNGPLQVYNIRFCIHDWKEFKRLPNDLALEYLVNLKHTYNATGSDISAAMGVNKTTMYENLRARGIIGLFPRGNHGKLNPDWYDFLKDKRTSTGVLIEEPKPAPVPEEPVAPPEPEPITPAPATIEAASVNSFKIDSFGKPEALLDLLVTTFADLTKADKRYFMRIHIVEDSGMEGGED